MKGIVRTVDYLYRFLVDFGDNLFSVYFHVNVEKTDFFLAFFLGEFDILMKVSQFEK